MGTQSTAKTLFLLASMVGWLTVGAALMYLSPVIIDKVLGSDRTHLWIENLSRGGYTPALAWMGGGIALMITVIGNAVWYRWFEDQQSAPDPSNLSN